AAHLRTVSNAVTVSAFRAGSFNRMYGQIDPQNQYTYEAALLNLIEALRDPGAVPFEETEQYFVSAVRLANTTIDSPDIMDIKPMMRMDQNEYLEMASKYREMEAEAAMKATEYKLMSVEQTKMYAQDRKMIDEQIAMNERMSAMSQAEAKAAEAAYAQVLQGFTGSLYIVAPRAGTISTIMAKVGQFVEPGMPVASLNSGDQSEQFVRFRIPGNVRLPEVGSVLAMMRPGFPQDVKKVKLLGVGTSLDAGMFMADAEFLESVNWPPDASVRVMASQASDAPVIKLSSVWWDEEGAPHVWGVSPGDRIFAKKITIGRTLGTFIEIYDGLKNSDRYVVNPEPGIHEDMLLEDMAPKESTTDKPAGSGGHDDMGGMDM
ncbi:MAG: hypothetical protein Q7S09_05990, partial [bacterium]|nr:hypothetical protein [bacterium]